MNLDLLSGLAEALDGQGLLAPRLQPAEGMCCVRLGGRAGSARPATDHEHRAGDASWSAEDDLMA